MDELKLFNTTENELTLSDITTDLFKNKVITKIEFEEFKAKEKAISEYVDFRLNKIEKIKNLRLRKLEVIERRIDYSKDLIIKIKNLTGDADKLSVNKKQKLLNILYSIISISTDELLSNFDSSLSIATKSKFLQLSNNDKKGK